MTESQERDPILIKDLQMFEHHGTFGEEYIRAQRLDETFRPGLIDAVGHMAARAGLEAPPRLYVLESDKSEMMTNPQTGSIAMTMGLLQDPAITNDMLVAGIAHEIGHHQVPLAGHVSTGMKIGVLASVVGGAAITLGALVTGHPGVAGMALEATIAGTVTCAAGSAQSSKKQEFDADHYAGYASGMPGALADLLHHGEERAAAHPGFNNHPVMQGLGKIFGSHPATALREHRLKKIEQNLDADGNVINRRDLPGPLRRHL